MAVITLNDLTNDQKGALEEYAKKLISGLDKTDEDKNNADVIVAHECMGQCALALYHNLDISMISGLDPANGLDPKLAREARLALQNGIDISAIQGLTAQEINDLRYENAQNEAAVSEATEQENFVVVEEPAVEANVDNGLDEIIDEATAETQEEAQQAAEEQSMQENEGFDMSDLEEAFDLL